MMLGVISDTHGHVRNTLAAIERLESSQVDVVLHCGDIGSAAIPPLFARWPTHFVLGNVDHEDELQGVFPAEGLFCHGRFGSVELMGKQIALLHGDDQRKWKEVTSSGQWDLVCYGHTHRAVVRKVGRTSILNPGAVFRADPHSVATVRLPELDVEFLRF